MTLIEHFPPAAMLVAQVLVSLKLPLCEPAIIMLPIASTSKIMLAMTSPQLPKAIGHLSMVWANGILLGCPFAACHAAVGPCHVRPFAT
jgi:hypothetical protein